MTQSARQLIDHSVPWTVAAKLKKSTDLGNRIRGGREYGTSKT